MPEKSTLKGVLLIITSAACISVTFVASKQAMQTLSPLGFTPLWFGAASLWGLGFYVGKNGLTWPVGVGTYIKPVLLIGIFNGIANLLLFTAINLGDPTLSAFFSRSETIYSVVLSALFLHERMQHLQWAGVAIAILGAGVMTFRAGSVVWLMLGILLLSNLFLSISYLLTKTQVQAVPSIVLSTARTLMITVILGIIALLFGELSWPDSTTWLWIWGGAFFGPFFSYILFYQGLRHIDLAKSTVIRTTQPLFVALYSLILFGTVITFAQFVGGILMIAGVALMLWQRNNVQDKSIEGV
ncbi:MAG: DMT family transporter [Chloroflexota bacterium]